MAFSLDCGMIEKIIGRSKIMPFINSKVSVPLTDSEKETLKGKLGQAISLIPGKSESWLMVGFEDNYSLK